MLHYAFGGHGGGMDIAEVGRAVSFRYDPKRASLSSIWSRVSTS